MLIKFSHKNTANDFAFISKWISWINNFSVIKNVSENIYVSVGYRIVVSESWLSI